MGIIAVVQPDASSDGAAHASMGNPIRSRTDKYRLTCGPLVGDWWHTLVAQGTNVGRLLAD